MNDYPTDNGPRFFAAGMEAARRLRGIPTPPDAGPFDEADVAFAMDAITGHKMTDRKQLDRYAEMRAAPAEVRETYKRPGRDTLEKLTGVRPRR